MILFIDCYDSFSYNLTRLIESACSEPIVVCHNDQLSLEQLKSYLPFLHAIILGPGPGDPHDPSDSGIVDHVWELVKQNPVPVFGVCFGFQSMVMHFGGIVERMSPPQHGQVAKIVHDGTSRIFKNIPSPFDAVRYHSLRAQVNLNRENAPKSVGHHRCKNLTNGSLRCIAVTHSGGHGEAIEMAAEHAQMPFFAVQFHPESVLSSFGRQIFANFWEVACEYNASRNIILGEIPQRLTVTHEPLLPRLESSINQPNIVVKKIAGLKWLQIAGILEDFILLKSASHPGRWTIFGILEPQKTRHIRSKNGSVFEGNLYSDPDIIKQNFDFWKYAANLMSKSLIPSELAESINPHGLPFLGGLIGYVTYEGGCQKSLNSGRPIESGMHSDISMVFVDKVVTIDEQTGEVYATGPPQWVQLIEQQFKSAQKTQLIDKKSTNIKYNSVSKPDRHKYDQMVSSCFENLESGNSYELCLTTNTLVDFPEQASAWEIFTQLVEKNPAPYCSFMNFDDCLIATSPERFMAWDRHSCEFRPIKGTVKKTSNMTAECAQELLSTPKEHAENLMIVDLIRHDIGQLLGKVSTKQLMGVEEYHSVFQLVTSVEGEFNGQQTGIDVLSQSLPPGSMTGAPKQRSVEILRDLEEQPRGLYSGVQGYWSIDDRGDWSVIIRSLFRRKDSAANQWQLGAGGAITVLSTAEGEFEEMNTKMDSVLKAFC